MTLSMAFFTFLNAWWIMLFFTLPFSIEKRTESNPLEYAASPRRIAWKKILISTTILAGVLTGMLALVIKSGIIPVHS